MTMRLTVTAVVLLSLAGCSSSSSSGPNYYRLPSLNEATTTFNCPTGVTTQVQVSRMLNGAGIVLQMSDVTWLEARQHRWLTPLQEQLSQRVQQAEHLQPWLCEQSVALVVTGFHGDHQGNAVVQGYWRWQSEVGEPVQDDFAEQVKLSADGYTALVKALDEGLQRVINKRGAEPAANN